MSVEGTLVGILAPIVGGTLPADPRVFPDVAPEGYEARPYITYQQVGGDPLGFLDRSRPDKKFARIQVNVWHPNRIEANRLGRLVQDRMTGPESASLQSEALGGMVATYDEDTKLRGTMQDFAICFAD